MAKSREELGLPPLIKEADIFKHSINLELLSAESKHLYGLMTAISADDPAIQDIIGEMDESWFDTSDTLHPKLFIGTSKAGEDAWLWIMVAGGSKVKPENRYTPMIKFGKKQTRVWEHISHIVDWKIPGLDPTMWMQAPRDPMININSLETRRRAWKRSLVRVWAACFPDAFIAESSAATEHSDLTIGNGDGSLEERYGIMQMSDWWSKFNESPFPFDLTNKALYQKVGSSYCDQKFRKGWGEEQLPPLLVLEQASQYVVWSHGRMKIEETFPFKLWARKVTSEMEGIFEGGNDEESIDEEGIDEGAIDEEGTDEEGIDEDGIDEEGFSMAEGATQTTDVVATPIEDGEEEVEDLIRADESPTVAELQALLDEEAALKERVKDREEALHIETQKNEIWKSTLLPAIKQAKAIVRDALTEMGTSEEEMATNREILEICRKTLVGAGIMKE